MRSRAAANNPAKAANQMPAKMQHPPPKICSANAQNLPPDPALLIAPRRKVPAKTQAPIPEAGRKNPAQAEPAGIFLASQQNRTAAILQQGRRIMRNMLENAARNQGKHAQNLQGQGHPNQECPNRAHHSRDRADMAGQSGGPCPRPSRAHATKISGFCLLPFLVIRQRQNILAV